LTPILAGRPIYTAAAEHTFRKSLLETPPGIFSNSGSLHRIENPPSLVFKIFRSRLKMFETYPKQFET
jgi:hypothetical protein